MWPIRDVFFQDVNGVWEAVPLDVPPPLLNIVSAHLIIGFLRQDGAADGAILTDLTQNIANQVTVKKIQFETLEEH